MRKPFLLSMVLLQGCFIFGSGGVNPFQEEKRAQRQWAKQHVVGKELQPSARHKTVREMRVRLHATDGYRRGKMDWKRRAEELIDNANQYLGPTFGVRLVVAQASNWKTPDDRADLNVLLSDLQEIDPGKDVDWVVGLAPALAGAVDDFDKMGLAEVPGRHFVIRDTNDPAERKWIEDNLPNLSAEERANAFATRRRHKTVVIFLHEWAHSLGADHTEDHADIMAPSYEPAQVTFGDRYLATLDDGLRTRSTKPQGVGPTAPWQIASDVPMELLRIGMTPDSPATEQRDLYKEKFWEVYRQFTSGQLDDARRSLRAARKKLPAIGWDQLECEIELAANHLTQAGRACQKALAAFDGLPRAHYLLGIVEAKRNRYTAAREHLEITIVLDPQNQQQARGALQRIKK